MSFLLNKGCGVKITVSDNETDAVKIAAFLIKTVFFNKSNPLNRIFYCMIKRILQERLKNYIIILT